MNLNEFFLLFLVFRPGESNNTNLGFEMKLATTLKNVQILHLKQVFLYHIFDTVSSINQLFETNRETNRLKLF
jgi:hypothetical protein